MAEYDEMMGALRQDARTADACPEATQNLELNLKNRQDALDTKEYGPANPGLDAEGGNAEFWQRYADKFNDTVENVMTMRCGNCSFFDTTDVTLMCIERGLGEDADPERAVEAGDLGYCQALDFKCASARVCVVWAGMEA
jgi:Fe-S cluster biogenesis protein NfuA